MLVVLVCAISGSVSRLSFPGYVSTEAPPLASHSFPVSTEFPGASSDFLQRDVRFTWWWLYSEKEIFFT